jgi:hypothetical protein
MCWALQTKWLWLQKTDQSRPWHGLTIPIQQPVKDLFAASLISYVGNGSNTLFWTDKWLNGCSIRDLAPEVASKVSKRALTSLTVSQALVNRQWIAHIKTPLSLIGIQQFLLLWDTLGEVQLSQEEDRHVWRHEASGLFSSKSCYKVLLFGSTVFEPWKRLWKTWAPPKCKFFLWLAIRNKCWTADRLQLRGMPHPDVCPMCDQAQETIQHLLTACIFARQFWHTILAAIGLGHLTPTADEENFADWWGKASHKVVKTRKKGLNSLIILGAWCLWLQRNRAVFHGESPSLPRIFRCFSDEYVCWVMAGAKEFGGLGSVAALGVVGSSSSNNL